MLAWVKPPRDVSLGERFAANFAEGQANTLAGAMQLYQRGGRIDRERAADLLVAIDRVRAAGSDVGVPLPVLDLNTMGFGIPIDANDPMIAGALLRN